MVNRLQENIRTSLDPISNDVFFDRQEISATISTSDTVIAHSLVRIPRAFILLDKTGLGDVYRVDWNSSTITLKSSVQVAIKFWLF